MIDTSLSASTVRRGLARFVFWSRWLQAPLYLGLIVVLMVYVYEFSQGLLRLIGSSARHLEESAIMLQALDLIDVVMIANLLVMVIVGGFETFVARLNLRDHPDHPDWLDEVNAGSMKTKVALALVGISSIHLLRTFIESHPDENIAKWQCIIHAVLVASALAIACTNRLLHHAGERSDPTS